MINSGVLIRNGSREIPQIIVVIVVGVDEFLNFTIATNSDSVETFSPRTLLHQLRTRGQAKKIVFGLTVLES